MDRKSKIVIIGGGVGGLTTAIALHLHGFTNITLFERRAASDPVGAGLTLWANAGRFLKELGLLDEVSAFGGRLNQMQRWTDDGDYLGGINVLRIDEAIGYPSYAVSKAEFQNLLQKRIVQSGIKLNYNTVVTGIENKGDGNVFLRLEHDSCIEADIIIGADGRMNSIAKKYIQGHNQPIYQHFINWVGILTNDYPFHIGNNILDYWGCGERFGIVPISANKLYWAGCKALPLDSVNKESTNKKELLNLFKNWPRHINTVVAKTPESKIGRILVFDHEPNPRWYKNNVCLLGDAAHASLPTSGQGACQAIEDAWHLARQLASFDTLKESFEAYRNIRFEKTAAITWSGRGLAKKLFNPDKNYCLVRNHREKLTDYKKHTEGMIRLWSGNLI